MKKSHNPLQTASANYSQSDLRMIICHDLCHSITSHYEAKSRNPFDALFLFPNLTLFQYIIEVEDSAVSFETLRELHRFHDAI